MEDFIRVSLPGIDEDTVLKLDAKLIEIGVLTIEDLQYVEEDYIKNILKPIQMKKFLDNCKNCYIIPPAVIATEEGSSNLSTVQNAVHSRDFETPLEDLKIENWVENFQIPFKAFPKQIAEYAEKGLRPPKVHINEMIRLIVSNMMKITETPGRKNLRVIASKIIQKYPGAFQDCWGDSIISGGVTTLMKKLENCIDNKKKTRSSIEDCFEGTEKRKKILRKSYGCARWQPLDIPDGNTKEDMIDLQNWLKEEFVKIDRDDDKINEVMTSCYSLQRYYINNVTSAVALLKNEWPFIFEEKYFLNHSCVLLDKEVSKIFSKDFPDKGKKIYDFMKTKTKLPKVATSIKKIESAKAEIGNLTPEFIGACSLIMAYFNEEESVLFKEKISPDDIKEETLLTPYLVAFGCNFFTAKEYTMVIDGEICLQSKDFLTALAILFCSYFVLNIEYNLATPATMEFIQRCIVGINPTRGTKVSKDKKNHAAITKKITKFANELNDFEKLFKV